LIGPVSTLVLALLASSPNVPPPLRLLAADPREEAASAFTEGEQAFARGEYEDAVSHFERAQQLAPHPHTLYNLGLAQQLAGDLPAAWGTFRSLETSVGSARERDDARKRLNRIERKVAVLRVEAEPRRRICLDSQPIPARDGTTFELAARAGEYELVLDEHRVPVRLEEGETRVLALVGAEKLWGAARTHRAVPALAGVTVGSAGLATVLGATALGVRDANADASFGLTIGATTAAAVATATGIAALVLHRRSTRRDRGTPRGPGGSASTGNARAASDDCPPHPALVRP
jgi:hypothetical protein